MDTHETILELERKFWEAAGDTAFYREHMADDGVMAFHVGILDKDDVVMSMETAAGWDSYTIDDLRFIELSEDVASITYRTTAIPSGSDVPYMAAVTSVYVQRSGTWQLMIHQQTPLG